MTDVEPAAIDDRRLRPARRGSGGGFAGVGGGLDRALALVPDPRGVGDQRVARSAAQRSGRDALRAPARQLLQRQSGGNPAGGRADALGAHGGSTEAVAVAHRDQHRGTPAGGLLGRLDRAAGEQPRRSLHRGDDRAAAGADSDALRSERTDARHARLLPAGGGSDQAARARAAGIDDLAAPRGPDEAGRRHGRRARTRAAEGPRTRTSDALRRVLSERADGRAPAADGRRYAVSERICAARSGRAGN